MSVSNEMLKSRLTSENYAKLAALNNSALNDFIASAIELCNPKIVFICSDAPEDIAYIRRQAVERGEEIPLATEGHTCHFDGPTDQARDKRVTRYLLPPGVDLGKNISSIDREEGLAEVKGLLRGIMADGEMIVRFFCLGPVDSDFSVSGVQITDSFYVAHSEDLLYRAGYEQFKRLEGRADFFSILHSAGELDELKASKNIEDKRIYMDLQDETVYSVNTQYAGNTIGFKKLSHRLAIARAAREGWLAEHMFLMGVHGPNDRVTYFSGAYPSFCGKTSTSMIPGETIVGDDLAYLRKRNGDVYSANVECGIFGIIRNLNPKDDPLLYNVITTPGEVIYSNVLISDGKPYWLGSGIEPPEEGRNFVGQWKKGMTDADGNEIPFAHKNARYTIRISALENRDPMADASAGVPLGGVIYGGRDSDTWMPVQESFDWAHGVITMGACIESETTAATVGQQGVRAFQPMANLDFVSIPLGQYIQNHLDFARDVNKEPIIFSTNYFIRDKENGEYLSSIKAKYVWVKWMELRVHGDAGAITLPTGKIPVYADLKKLFRDRLDEDYTEELYTRQFILRIPENLQKIERMTEVWKKIENTPAQLFEMLEQQRQRLLKTQAEKGDYVMPQAFL